MATFVNGIKVDTKKKLSQTFLATHANARAYAIAQAQAIETERIAQFKAERAKQEAEHERLTDVLETGYLTPNEVQELVSKRMLQYQSETARNLAYWSELFNCLLEGMPEVAAESYAEMASEEYERSGYKPRRNGGYIRCS